MFHVSTFGPPPPCKMITSNGPFPRCSWIKFFLSDCCVLMSNLFYLGITAMFIVNRAYSNKNKHYQQDSRDNL